MIKPILLKDRDMVVNKHRLNDFIVAVKENYFKYYIEPYLKQTHIDKWFRNQIIINIEMFASYMKDLYYEYDKMPLNKYLAKIGWDAWINIFKNDFDEKDNRKGLGEDNFMKKYLYESHLGGLFWSNNKIDDEYLYCEECGDYDEYLGEACNIEEAKALIDKVSHPYRDDEDADEEDREFCQYTDEHIKELLEEFDFKPSIKSPNRMESKIDQTVREINSGLLKFNMDFISNPEKMKELGFYDAGEYWLYDKFLPIKDKKYKDCEFSFDFQIYKKDTVEKSSLCILDEDFCQPYDYYRCAADDLYYELNSQVIDTINDLVQKDILIPDESYAMGAKRTC